MNDTRPDLDTMRAQIADSLQDVAYVCTRVWEAWQYGTMTVDDFAPAWEDDDLLDSLVQVAAAALVAERERTEKAWDEGYMAVPAEPEDREMFIEDAPNPYRAAATAEQAT